MTKIATDKQIRALSDEAAQYGDDMQLLVCYRALNADFDYDDYSGGGHRLSRKDETRLRAMTQGEARILCTAAIQTEATAIDRAQLYWDDQDPRNPGWWLRYYHSDTGNEDGRAIEGDEDASTEDLARAVTKAEIGRTGKIAVLRGGNRKGWIKIEGGDATDWSAV